MTYQRPLVVVELAGDPGPAAVALRRAAPGVEKLVVLALGDGAGDGELRAAFAGCAREVDLRVARDPTGLTLAAAASASDLVVAGSVARAVTACVLEARRWLCVPVLWAAAEPAATGERHILGIARGARSLATIGAFLRDHVPAGTRVTVAALAAPVPLDDLPAVLDVAGIRASVDVLPLSWRALPRLAEWARDHSVELLVISRPPPALPLRALVGRGVSVLSLPLPPAGAAPAHQPLEVSELVELAGTLRARVELPATVGRPAPLDGEEVAFVSGGRIVARAKASGGIVEIASSAAPRVAAFGLLRSGADDGLDGIEHHVAVVRAGPRLLLFDAALADAELAAVRAAAVALQPVAVRLRPAQRFELIRARLRAAGMAAPRVLDASAVLDEGEPLDVPDEADAVRLARVATRLRGGGIDVAAVVHRGRHTPLTVGFPAVRTDELATVTPGVPPPAAGNSLAARLLATTGAPRLDGHRIDVELDNAVARVWLLGAIAAARESVHLQTYIVADDEIAHLVERALAEAAARGVAVRVLVDSLHALHGSLGSTNPVLARLAALPGIEVRVLRPVTGLPSIEDLKLRDHRKLVVVDGRVALVGGRNLAHEYYTAWSEETVTARTPWKRVPWLDAGARVEGPAVAALQTAFRDAWVAAGGASFAVAEAAPAGSVTARVVVHHGLRDAFSIETYRALIDTARERLHVVVGFPLQLELQHALLRALRRGVRVRVLVGAALPTFGDHKPFAGPLAAARGLATQFLHSRLDTLVEAGAEVYELALRDVPGWAPALGVVRPYVHAKLMTADGAVAAVGSANLDITAGYWESELLLVVEDALVVAALDARLDGILAHSLRMDRADPSWQRLAAGRAWWRHWPGMLG